MKVNRSCQQNRRLTAGVSYARARASVQDTSLKLYPIHKPSSSYYHVMEGDICPSASLVPFIIWSGTGNFILWPVDVMTSSMLRVASKKNKKNISSNIRAGNRVSVACDICKQWPLDGMGCNRCARRGRLDARCSIHQRLRERCNV